MTRKSFTGHAMVSRIQRALRNLAQDTRGVSAVEFALILPIMITMYIGAVEFSDALTVNRRVTAVASTAADLTAQAEQVTSGDVSDIFSAATSILAPYSTTPISIVLTSVVADGQNATTVEWSCSLQGAPRLQGAPFELPAGLTQPFSSIVVAEVTYNYSPPLGKMIVGNINMSETFYLRPRRSLKVEMQGAGC